MHEFVCPHCKGKCLADRNGLKGIENRCADAGHHRTYQFLARLDVVMERIYNGVAAA